MVVSNISDAEKRELVVAINPLLKKQLAISSEFDEKSYMPLIDLILAEDYDKIVKEICKIKKIKSQKG